MYAQMVKTDATRVRSLDEMDPQERAFQERIEAGQPPLILGDGTQTMDFVHVADIARANLLAARSPLTDEVFNVASGAETSLRELATALLGVMGSDLEVEYGPARTVNAVTRRLADTSSAARRLGFWAELGLPEGLRDLVDWWRAQRAAQGAVQGAAQGEPATAGQGAA